MKTSPRSVRKRAKLLALFASLFALCTSLPAWGADAYPIRLVLPYRTGDVVSISANASYAFSESPTDPASTVGKITTSFIAALDGTRTILAVDQRGLPVEEVIRVSHCTKDGVPLLAAGVMIQAKSADIKIDFTIDGKAPTEQVRRALSELISMPLPRQASPDDAWGSDQPRKVGEAWPVNCDLLAKATRLPYPLTQDDYVGQGQLIAVSDVNGVPSETVELNDECSFDKRKGSNGRTYQALNRVYQMILTVPINGSVHLSRNASKSLVTFTVSSSRGTFNVREERNTESKCAELAK